MSSLWRQALRSFGGLCLYGLVICLLTDRAVSQEDRPRHFELNEDMIRAVNTPANPQACSPNEVLGDLFKQISPVARIYPTENYYYFSFYRGGKSYSGSLRLAVDSRDDGIVQYACYETYTSWLEVNPKAGLEKQLSRDDGVFVTKISDFEYNIEFQDIGVTFVLNNIDQTPDKDKLRKGEKFVGRIFDESALIFDLVYNTIEKAFYFVLDTRKRIPDAFVRMKDNVYVGKRTGFVFFEDVAMKRFILIAVHSEEVNKNTPYDGPGDQLPENFYKDLGFLDYVYEAHPDLVGKLTSGGTYINSGSIFAIYSYRDYFSKKDFGFIDSCITKNPSGTKLILCLTRQHRSKSRR
jgi:hypothetical protein